MKIPITKPITGKLEQEMIQKPLETGWLVQGPYVAEFEKLFCDYTRAAHAKATTSCTTALHLGLTAMGVGQGDKVVVPAFTWVASANVVEHVGAEVVFCDIDLRTFNMDVDELEKICQQQSIKAVMPVNLFGLCADLPRIMALAEQYNFKVIEDSACGFGSWVNNLHSGTVGHCGTFSFHPRKAITTGEGGMFITNDAALFKKASILLDHGASQSDYVRHKDKYNFLLPDFAECGFNYRMTDFQGALGVAQMSRANEILEGRVSIAKKYDQALKSFKQVDLPFVPGGYQHSYQSYVLLYTGGQTLTDLNNEQLEQLHLQRNEFMKYLADKDIATRPGTHAVHALKFYREKYHLNATDYKKAFIADQLSVSIPLYAGMTNEEFEYVVEHIQTGLVKAEQLDTICVV